MIMNFEVRTFAIIEFRASSSGHSPFFADVRRPIRPLSFIDSSFFASLNSPFFAAFLRRFFYSFFLFATSCVYRSCLSPRPPRPRSSKTHFSSIFPAGAVAWVARRWNGRAGAWRAVVWEDWGLIPCPVEKYFFELKFFAIFFFQWMPSGI